MMRAFFSYSFILSHSSLWKYLVQGVIEMIELLGVLIGNVPINQPLRLCARPNLQMLAEGGNVLSIFWTSCEQLQRQNIVTWRYIHFKQSVGAPQGPFWRRTSVVEEVADEIIEPGAWKLVLLSNCPYRCLEALRERRVHGVLHIFMQHVDIIGRGSIVNLREHECPTD